MASQVAVVDIPSDPDDDDTAAAASPPAPGKRPHAALAATSPGLLDFSPSPPRSKRRPSASPIVLDDTPTPPKRRPSADPANPVSGVAKARHSAVPCSLGFGADVAETPNTVLPCSSLFHDHAAVVETPGSSVPFSIGLDIVVDETPGFTSPRKFSGVSCPISLDSDDELDDAGHRDQLIKVPSNTAKSEPAIHPCSSSSSDKVISTTSTYQDYLNLSGPQTTLSAHKNRGTANIVKPVHADLPYESSTPSDADGFGEKQSLQKAKEHKKGKNAKLIEERKEKQQEKKRLQKEEKARLIEERKQKREENKMQKEAMKVQLAETKKLNKEIRKWESGKLASKSIIAEIDSMVAESGSIGGLLLTRFAGKDLKYRLTANSIKGSILWRMDVPKEIAQHQASVSEVPYILFVLQAEEFCDLISSESFFDHVHKVRTRYPTFTICYVINKLTSYIKKREQSHYKNPSNSSWKRPPVEEVLCKLATHYAGVHSRQCTDEAEVAEHVVGLTSSLANCQFRKPLTWLSVHANGSVIPNGFIDKGLAKKDNWLKSLIAIPKVQPRHAMAIWKKYRSMRSLLNVYMDPNRTVREKELLLKDLMLEDPLGDENRRFGEKCSTRVYRILMAQNGEMKVDDLEK